MSQKRYFYTDPLAAAWMAKYHGMTLYIGHLPDDYDAYSAVNWWHAIDDERYRREKFKQLDIHFFVHPDSLHLLEAQMDDWGGDRRISGNVISITASLVTIDTIERHNGKTHYCIPRFEFRTQKRNGIAFIWPETEPSESPQPNPGE
jgi:hypothetical protein